MEKVSKRKARVRLNAALLREVLYGTTSGFKSRMAKLSAAERETVMATIESLSKENLSTVWATAKLFGHPSKVICWTPKALHWKSCFGLPLPRLQAGIQLSDTGVIERMLNMRLFNQPATWIILAVAIIIVLLPDAPSAIPRRQDSSQRCSSNCCYWCLLYVFAVKAFFFNGRGTQPRRNLTFTTKHLKEDGSGSASLRAVRPPWRTSDNQRRYWPGCQSQVAID